MAANVWKSVNYKTTRKYAQYINSSNSSFTYHTLNQSDYTSQGNFRNRQQSFSIIMGSFSNESLFSSLSEIPLDPHYALKEFFNSDTDPKKVILGSGLYRDDNSKPWVLPTVQLVSIISLSHFNLIS
jgi:hypothetical protein